jgi:DNA-binding IclR family transcriptional regulator
MKVFSFMKKTAAAPTLHAPALQRGLALLQELATRPRGASQSELAEALHLPQTAVHRLALTLEHLGYLSKEPASRSWRVTHKLLLLGQPHSGARSLVEACLPAMRQILELTNETTQLCVLAGQDCVLLEQLPSRHPFKYVVDLGSRPPIQCCAPGKAMLAFLDEPQLHAILSKLRFEAHTPRSIVNKAALQKELDRVRDTGFALDAGEHLEGIHCIAAPLLNAHGTPFAAITIAGPSTRIPKARFAEWGNAIREAASDAALRFML